MGKINFKCKSKLNKFHSTDYYGKLPFLQRKILKNKWGGLMLASKRSFAGERQFPKKTLNRIVVYLEKLLFSNVWNTLD